MQTFERKTNISESRRFFKFKTSIWKSVKYFQELTETQAIIYACEQAYFKSQDYEFINF